jgi:hypothetical protein
MSSISSIIEKATTPTPADKPKTSPEQRKIEWAIDYHFVYLPSSEEVLAIPHTAWIAERYAGYYVMQVFRSSHTPFANFRYTFGTILPSGVFVPNISPRTEGQREGKTEIDDTAWDALITLAQFSRAWNRDEKEHQTAKYVERKGSSRWQPRRGAVPVSEL